MVSIILGLMVAGIFFFVAYKIIKPKKLQEGENTLYVCDVCNSDVCECRKVEEDD